ncbi:glycosyltransferase family 2 protein [Marivita geojedonensis]|uniref:glycosyltransferase family 2 protein n=1 Tax=Marivita geojedonensis TaxID=1123756 RepID=UPI000A1F8D9B|nr:glycosyltransferase family 2 protein [Marivita geojedonensis]PRY74213.1 glycosyltransferase involved in cell wall biosynthesis [Marivita geojedonensis]
MSGPWVSVVTVCRNARELLPETIESVIAQDFDDFEYIVVDGASDDGSLEVIDNYREFIDQFVSEPDKGVYDAMNKAAAQALGKYIIFINAGDVFATDNVLSLARRISPDEADFLYGISYWINDGKLSDWKTRPLNEMWKRNAFSHQSLFSRTNLLKRRPFDTSLKIVADYKFIFERYTEGCIFFNLDFPIAYMLPGGISDLGIYKRTFERWSVVAKIRPKISTHIYFIKLLLTEIIPQHFRRMLR